MLDINQNLIKVKERITKAAAQYNRDPHTITLIAVSKTQPITAITQAIEAGQLAFGENYLSEALTKINALPNPNISWHYIGKIQSNKTKLIAENFAWVQSIDRPKIAKLLNQHRPTPLPPLKVCIEVNIDNETSKSGIAITEVAELAELITTLPKLQLSGIMTIPKPSNDFNQQRLAFAKVRAIYDNLIAKGFKLDTLSMGMSDDLEAAIAEGATMVRIGTAIFGQRKQLGNNK